MLAGNFGGDDEPLVFFGPALDAEQARYAYIDLQRVAPRTSAQAEALEIDLPGKPGQAQVGLVSGGVNPMPCAWHRIGGLL